MFSVTLFSVEIPEMCSNVLNDLPDGLRLIDCEAPVLVFLEDGCNFSINFKDDREWLFKDIDQFFQLSLGGILSIPMSL